MLNAFASLKLLAGKKKTKNKNKNKIRNKKKRHANLMYKSLTTHLQIARILSKDTLRWPISKNHI